MKRATWMFAASAAVVALGAAQVFGSTTPKNSTSAAKPFTVSIPLKAFAVHADRTLTTTPVKDVRFVVVDPSGQVLATHSGAGTVKVTLPHSGFWESSNGNQPPSNLNNLGVVEILAYAPHMVDTIMLDVAVSPGPIAFVDPIPMKPMIDPLGHNTPNEPFIVLGTDVHHLVADGLSSAYSKYAHITSSYLRNTK